MKEDFDAGANGAPQGVRRHEEPRFGFALEVPRRFVRLGSTADPIARMMRHLDGAAVRGCLEREAQARGAWPQGFCDPETLADVGEGRLQPLRLLEIDAYVRDEPVTDVEAPALWFGVREYIPEELEACCLPGYRLLDVREAALGSLDGLAFDYRWDGLRPGDDAGDRAQLRWALAPMTLFHVYYHCPASEWDVYLPEYEFILASFELLDRRG